MCIKKYLKWVNKNLKKINAWDMALIKVSLIAFGLLIAKLWPTILALDWYWYLIIFIVAIIKPMKTFYSK
jgi:uncharacterized protein YacL